MIPREKPRQSRHGNDKEMLEEDRLLLNFIDGCPKSHGPDPCGQSERWEKSQLQAYALSGSGLIGQACPMLVSGIYQDVTNGGKTAKAILTYNTENVLWYIVSVDVKPGIGVSEKTDEKTMIYKCVRKNFLFG